MISMQRLTLDSRRSSGFLFAQTFPVYRQFLRPIMARHAHDGPQPHWFLSTRSITVSASVEPFMPRSPAVARVYM